MESEGLLDWDLVFILFSSGSSKSLGRSIASGGQSCSSWNGWWDLQTCGCYGPLHSPHTSRTAPCRGPQDVSPGGWLLRRECLSTVGARVGRLSILSFSAMLLKAVFKYCLDEAVTLTDLIRPQSTLKSASSRNAGPLYTSHCRVSSNLGQPINLPVSSRGGTTSCQLFLKGIGNSKPVLL